MYNLIKIQDELKSLPSQAIMAYANGQNPQVPPYLALAELNRRKQVESTAAHRKPAETPTVKEQVEQAAGLLDLQKQRAAAVANNSAEQAATDAIPGVIGDGSTAGMARGGIVSLAKGGDLNDVYLNSYNKHKEMFSDMRDFDPDVIQVIRRLWGRPDANDTVPMQISDPGRDLGQGILNYRQGYSKKMPKMSPSELERYYEWAGKNAGVKAALDNYEEELKGRNFPEEPEAVAQRAAPMPPDEGIPALLQPKPTPQLLAKNMSVAGPEAQMSMAAPEEPEGRNFPEEPEAVAQRAAPMPPDEGIAALLQPKPTPQLLAKNMSVAGPEAQIGRAHV